MDSAWWLPIRFFWSLAQPGNYGDEGRKYGERARAEDQARQRRLGRRRAGDCRRRQQIDHTIGNRHGLRLQLSV